jgi:hypothetical protein
MALGKAITFSLPVSIGSVRAGRAVFATEIHAGLARQTDPCGDFVGPCLKNHEEAPGQLRKDREASPQPGSPSRPLGARQLPSRQKGPQFQGAHSPHSQISFKIAYS